MDVCIHLKKSIICIFFNLYFALTKTAIRVKIIKVVSAKSI